MIDTIKFLIPIDNSEVFESIKNQLTRTRRENMKTNELKFEYFTEEIEVGSYERTVRIYLKQDSPKGVFVEFSLPKQYYDNNVEMIHAYDIEYVLDNFKNDVCQFFQERIPPIEQWIIYRLDVCYNWTFESEQKCQSIMNFIQRIDFPKKKKYVYDTSVMYKGSAYTIKFYLKGAEFKRHDYKDIFKKDMDKADLLLNWAEKVLRFEVEFKKGYLSNLFPHGKVLVSSIVYDKIIEDILKKYLTLVFRYVNKENMKYENVRQLIDKSFKPAKALRLYQFYKGYFYEQDEKFHIKKGLNPSTIWRYKNDLKNIGVSFEENLGDSSFVAVEELIVPSGKGKFDLLDYKLTSDYS
ncbi:MAG: phage/plasmid replication protein [Candidatus Pacebacteria bacterium]|nr:phage/plasmid replication protein [Candidatus Paceibacterota bacterium]